MKFNKFFLSLLAFPIFLSARVMAHCPLCTIGAAGAAGAAIWLGVSKVVVALFIGAFAMSMGMWTSKLVKKKFIPLQPLLITAVIFALTFFPIMPMFSAIGPLYLSFVGTYGTTFAVDYSLFVGFFGGLIIFVSPTLNKKITRLRKGKHIPFQGMILSFSILLIVGAIIQLLI